MFLSFSCAMFLNTKYCLQDRQPAKMKRIRRDPDQGFLNFPQKHLLPLSTFFICLMCWTYSTFDIWYVWHVGHFWHLICLPFWASGYVFTFLHFTIYVYDVFDCFLQFLTFAILDTWDVISYICSYVVVWCCWHVGQLWHLIIELWHVLHDWHFTCNSYLFTCWMCLTLDISHFTFHTSYSRFYGYWHLILLKSWTLDIWHCGVLDIFEMWHLLCVLFWTFDVFVFVVYW